MLPELHANLDRFLYHLNEQSLDYEEMPNLNSNAGTDPGLELCFGFSSQSRDCWLECNSGGLREGGREWVKVSMMLLLFHIVAICGLL